MKRLFNIIGCVAAFAGILAGMSACVPDGIHHRKGNYDPDIDPWRGGGKNSDVINLEYGYADFYGQWYTDNTDNYLLYLYAGDTDSEGYFKNSGVILTLDLLLPKKGDLTIASGVYKCSDEGNTYTFIPTYKSKDNDYEGSVLYIQKNKNSYGYSAIQGGAVSITRKVTGVYEITAEITTQDGKKYSLKFSGMIDIEDKTHGQEGGDEDVIPKDVEMNNITRVVAEDWGMIWDGIPCTSYRDYILFFYDEDYINSNEYTCIEILTEEKYQLELPAATFNKVVAIGSPDEFVPGAIIAGYSDEDDLAWGTWYCKGGTAWYAATKGSLDIKASENGYKLTFDFVDEDETYGGTFKGSYEGKVDFTLAETKSVDTARRPVGIANRQISRVKVLDKVKREVSLGRVAR